MRALAFTAHRVVQSVPDVQRFFGSRARVVRSSSLVRSEVPGDVRTCGMLFPLQQSEATMNLPTNSLRGTQFEAIEDFTEEIDPPKPFKIDGDVFYAVGAPPAGALLDLAELANMGEDPAKALGSVASFLDTILLAESAQKFAQRMRDPENPITQKQLMRILQWLIQEYGNRPTVPASSSQGGQASTGTPTTGTAQTEASIPGSFL